MKGYFITATDTDAGKTFITAGLLKQLSNQGYKTLGFKPVASGCQTTAQGLQNDDALQLMRAANVALDYQSINPYAFEPAIAPHIAAQQVGVTIDLATIASNIEQQKQKADYVLVEGVGGWLVPLNARETVADLAQLLGFPVILVVNMRLGCINHALLTAQAIAHKGLTLAGWIANNAASDANTQNDPSMACLEENIQTLKTLLRVPLLGCVPYLSVTRHNDDTLLSGFVDLDKCI